MAGEQLFHFSEDPDIDVFTPHVPATNPNEPAAVWAIDETHAPLYWFPRDCPRVTAWPRTEQERSIFAETFQTTSHRVHAVELAWVETIAETTLYRYTFDAVNFVPWPEASGQWTAASTVEPLAVEPLDNLLALHADAHVDLRLCASLWPLHDLVVSTQWDFSIVRMRNAQQRPDTRPKVRGEADRARMRHGQ